MRTSFVVFIMCLMCQLLLLAPDSAYAFEAGAGKADITPPLGSPLNGYGDRMGRGAVAVHDPLSVRALYMNDGQTPVLLVSADLVIINRELRARALDLAPKEVPRNNIILVATHTHSGSGGMIEALPFRSISGRFIPELVEFTAQRFADAMRAAVDNRKRAAIGYGLTQNKGLSSNRRDDKGPVDPQIGVIRIDDADGVPISIVTNFAAHPTTVSDDDMYLISADYPGFYYTSMEQLAGAGCVSLFLNGAEGNQRPTNPENREPWGRTESIGRLLATAAWEAALAIKCGDARLSLKYSEPATPRTLVNRIMPESTVLHLLEINDLAMEFVPGEPCVEVGMLLRQRATERGYAAQFTVGLANDEIGYFAPPEYYCQPVYESGMNFYGPLVSDWMAREFSRLMTRGEPDPDPVPTELPRPEALEKAAVEGASAPSKVAYQGAPYQIGYQRGAAFRDLLQARYRDKVQARITSGEWKPEGPLWSMGEKYLNLTSLSTATFGMGARKLLNGVSMGTLAELAGMADGAELPFDSLWLTQCLPAFSALGDVNPYFSAPFCTMFAAIGRRAGADDLLVGRNLDWSEAETPIIEDITPVTGNRFVQIGFGWNAGVFTGMNAAGLVVCAERTESFGAPGKETAPVEYVLRDVLQYAKNYEDALGQVLSRPGLRGYRVLVADGSLPACCVIELAASPVVRKAVDGFLLAADPSAAGTDEAAKSRYARVATLLGKEHIISSDEVAKALRDREEGKTGRATILNDDTKYSVVFEPSNGRVRVSFAGSAGVMGDAVTVSLPKPQPVKK